LLKPVGPQFLDTRPRLRLMDWARSTSASVPLALVAVGPDSQHSLRATPTQWFSSQLATISSSGLPKG